MKSLSYLRAVALAFVLTLAAMPVHLRAQSTGSIEFIASVTPTDGRPEPVRQLTFYLLRKSLDDIRQETAQTEPAPDMDKFVDGLTVSPALKTWMKKNHTVQLSGEDFTRALTADAIVDVPEFFNPYIMHNVGLEAVGFPKPKFKEKDRTAHPEKYEQEKEDYKAAVRKYITATPESVQGLDADLNDINPFGKWTQLLDKHRRRVEKRTMDLAQTHYLMAETDTNLDGRGVFANIAAGDYWLGTLGTQAVSGDVRLRWDLRVTVRPGAATRVELTNLNAVEPSSSKPNSNP